MHSPLVQLAKKRQHLVAQAQLQRLAVAAQLQVLHKPISLLDTGLNMVRYIKRHPVLVASGGSALLSMLKPSGLSLWLQRGLLTWQLLGRLRKKMRE